MTNDNKDTETPTRSEITRMLDDALRPLRERHFDSYKAFTTIIFTALALLLGVLGVLSRIEVRDQVNDMQTRFEKQEAEMREQFALLAGEALKKPSLEILYDGKALEGQTIEVPYRSGMSPKYARLQGIFIRNSGDRRTEPISLQISIGAEAGPIYLIDDQSWDGMPSFDRSYGVSFYLSRQMTVAPGETAGVYPMTLDFQMSDSVSVPAKIEVFYGGAQSAKAFFSIQFKPT